MNNTILMGRLTRDPEVSCYNDNKPMAKYYLAVDRWGTSSTEQSADFIPCIAFDRAAEFASKHLKKGMRIIVKGHIRSGSYINREGHKVNSFAIIIETQEFADSKHQSTPEPSFGSEFMDIPDNPDPDLPFN